MSAHAEPLFNFDFMRAEREIDAVALEARRLLGVAQRWVARVDDESPAREPLMNALGLAARLGGLAADQLSALDTARRASPIPRGVRPMHPEDIGLTSEGRMPSVEI